MSNFLSTLEQRIILGDGALGTMLYNKGIFINRNFDEINLSDPKMVQDIHREYKSAGADFLTTNTFGGNYFRLKVHGLEEKLELINSTGVRLAREVAGEDLFVAGSMGPLSVTIEPYGMTSESDAKNAFAEQAKILDKSGVDFFILETFLYLHEILIAIKAIREVSSLPIVAQLTITNEGTTIIGEQPEKFAIELDRAGADVIGINCSGGPKSILEGIEKMVKHSKKPIIAQPNAGLPKLVE
ncbi:MAG: homocysteine S-methyltransferase family protein, partial [Spirochaetota bacterium]|nr:homocysteine S-methyltransferase family protein [Spirochaetota bacterium]